MLCAKSDLLNLTFTNVHFGGPLLWGSAPDTVGHQQLKQHRKTCELQIHKMVKGGGVTRTQILYIYSLPEVQMFSQ